MLKKKVKCFTTNFIWERNIVKAEEKGVLQSDSHAKQNETSKKTVLITFRMLNWREIIFAGKT